MSAPSTASADRRYRPALDGVRALAISAVLAYHLSGTSVPGGYLGVDLFFVLSGFLITSLLLDERARTGRVWVGRFWSRRARRLLPALVVLLVTLSVAEAVGALSGVTDPGALRADALSTLFYVANWHQLVAGQSYFASFAAPSPLAHTWSLAIEEQFYVAWPLVVAGVLWLAHRRPGRRLALATVVAAASSAAWMAWLSTHGASIDRLYYGTDTRAFELLAGAALAMALSARPVRSSRTTRLVHVAGPVGLAVLVWFCLGPAGGGASGTAPRWMFEGGMVLCVLAAVALVADTASETPGPLGRVLSVAPLSYLGRISYALYLWHWPVVTQLTAARVGVSGTALGAIRLGASLALATASTLLVEEPLRRADFARLRPYARRAVAVVGIGATAAVVAASGVAVAGAANSGPAVDQGTAVAGAGGFEGQPPLQLARAASPLRITLVGDSVMRTQAPAVAAALGSTGGAVVTDMAYPGWGLSTDAKWRSTMPAILKRTHPQLVVATWSWDGDWALRSPAEYRVALADFVAVLLHPPHGAPGASAVLLEQFPPLGPLPFVTGGAAGQARRVAGVTAWNAAAKDVAAQFPGKVLFLPLAGAVENEGRYTTWIRSPGSTRWLRVRQIDATHFCPAGAARYANALLADLHIEGALPAGSSQWWSGRWTADPIYRTPPGSCPADSPPR